ncbi:hypothetical protein KUCAC02_009878, partial [Chaenocephalus aceratus]
FEKFKLTFPEAELRSLMESYGTQFDLNRLKVMYNMSNFLGHKFFSERAMLTAVPKRNISPTPKSRGVLMRHGRCLCSSFIILLPPIPEPFYQAPAGPAASKSRPWRDPIPTLAMNPGELTSLLVMPADSISLPAHPRGECTANQEAVKATLAKQKHKLTMLTTAEWHRLQRLETLLKPC